MGGDGFEPITCIAHFALGQTFCWFWVNEIIFNNKE